MKSSKTITCLQKMACSLVTGVLIAAAGFDANANTISLGNVSQVPGGGGSDWTYSYSFANSYVKDGDYFTINDFGPATLIAIANPLWVLKPQTLTGRNDIPPLLGPGDSAGVLNVTFEWTGGDTAVGTGGPFTFTLRSPNTDLIGSAVSYTTGDHQASDPSKVSNGLGTVDAPGNVNVPDGGTTLALLGFALTGVECLRRKLAAKKA